jgi:hypothetical protein
MFALTRILSLAAVGVFVALTAVTTRASSDEMVQNLGPVGPHEPILATFGSKRIIAFYHPDSGKCAVHLVLWNPADDKAESTVGYKATLNPLQMAHVDSAENESLHLQCSDHAQRLVLVDPNYCIRFAVVATGEW